MIGLIVGAASGGLQFLLLSKFVNSITGGSFNLKSVFPALIQFFIPLPVLLGCALISQDALIWTGIGMAAALLGCALIKFVLLNRR